jgi:hypothetical protein
MTNDEWAAGGTRDDISSFVNWLHAPGTKWRRNFRSNYGFVGRAEAETG